MAKTKRAILALENGDVYEGMSFGADGEKDGEVVFNTSMTGYQEILTDPSYKGQIVTMTYPLIGNYGVNAEDCESARPFVEGFIVKEYSRIVSNFRAEQGLGDFLKKYGIPGIEGVDTRAITKTTRVQGAMKGILSTTDCDKKRLVKKAKESPGLLGRDLVSEVCCSKKYEWNKKGRYNVTVVDTGVKYNILRELENNDCRVTVVPPWTTSREILDLKPDGVLLSNGPGDPSAVTSVIETTRLLLGKIPIFGICLGHQLLCLAFGGKTYKLKFGHHGGNHPVKDLKTGKIFISVQNHGFCADENSLPDKDIEITHMNLNDNTVEGLSHRKLPVFSVQFHPEASPGPHDTKYLFENFIQLMKSEKSYKYAKKN